MSGSIIKTTLVHDGIDFAKIFMFFILCIGFLFITMFSLLIEMGPGNQKERDEYFAIL